MVATALSFNRQHTEDLPKGHNLAALAPVVRMQKRVYDGALRGG